MTQKAPLTRRGFLRLSVIAAGSAVAAACQKALTDAIAVATATASPSPAPSVKMDIGGNRDVWAWTKPMLIEVSEGECENMIVHVNDQEFEAYKEGKFFSSEVTLDSGENRISATCLQAGAVEVTSEAVIFTGRLRQAPMALIDIALNGEQIVLDGRKSLPAEDGAPIVNYLWSAQADNPGPLERLGDALTGEISTQAMSVTPPEIDGEYYVSLRVVDDSGREDTSTIYFVVENGQPRIPDYDHENPAWIENTVVYGVIPFLFGAPAFQAIGERLDDLVDLGINAIWLAPINVHPADDYGYHVEDYFGLDPAYGTKED
ncbi:MAG TPA: alpha-amylase family glycosyl hydrolase, partial [Anaerolineales bacterium]